MDITEAFVFVALRNKKIGRSAQVARCNGLLNRDPLNKDRRVRISYFPLYGNEASGSKLSRKQSLLNRVAGSNPVVSAENKHT
jgi:hypothetical protein